MEKTYRNASNKTICLFDGKKSVRMKPGQIKLLARSIDVVFYEKHGALRQVKQAKPLKPVVVQDQKVEEPKISKKKYKK